MNSKMKKIFVICLTALMVLSLSVNVFAAPGGFVKSPSGNAAPRLVSFVPSDENCTAELVITPYSERRTLPDDLQSLIGKAYDSIVASDDLTKLNADLAKLAGDKKIDGSKLAVSDLFDVRLVGCDSHEGHAGFEITLAADTLDRFVGLLHMNNDGVWELVANAEVVNDGENLKFSVDSLSPFAIVVDSTPGAPQTGDNTAIYICGGVMAVSACAIILIVIKRKKQKI